jgi:hypothetical protein
LTIEGTIIITDNAARVNPETKDAASGPTEARGKSGMSETAF